jgi:hypothetical protein
MGSLNELIDALATSYPIQQRALMELRECLELVVEKPHALVTHIGEVINDFVTKANSAAHIGPIPEAASTFAAHPQQGIKNPSPQKVEVPKKAAEAKGDPKKKGDAGHKAVQFETKTGTKSKFLPLDEYKEMLKKMSPEERTKLDNDRDVKAMKTFNDFLKKQGKDAKKFLEKSKRSDGESVCHLKRSSHGDGLVYVDKSLQEKMEDYERNALRRLVKVSLRHHGIDKLKTEADKAKSRVMMVASWHRSRDHDEFAELSSEDGSEDESEDGSSEEENYAVNS